jgi:hypothetical protein
MIAMKTWDLNKAKEMKTPQRKRGDNILLFIKYVLLWGQFLDDG